MAQVWLARGPYKADVVGSSPAIPIKDTDSKYLVREVQIFISLQDLVCILI